MAGVDPLIWDKIKEDAMLQRTRDSLPTHGAALRFSASWRRLSKRYLWHWGKQGQRACKRRVTVHLGSQTRSDACLIKVLDSLLLFSLSSQSAAYLCSPGVLAPLCFLRMCRDSVKCWSVCAALFLSLYTTSLIQLIKQSLIPHVYIFLAHRYLFRNKAR